MKEIILFIYLSYNPPTEVFELLSKTQLHATRYPLSHTPHVIHLATRHTLSTQPHVKRYTLSHTVSTQPHATRYALNHTLNGIY